MTQYDISTPFFFEYYKLIGVKAKMFYLLLCSIALGTLSLSSLKYEP